jgi:hypothetical protein
MRAGEELRYVAKAIVPCAPEQAISENEGKRMHGMIET